MRVTAVLIAALGAGAVVASPYDQPYSLVESGSVTVSFSSARGIFRPDTQEVKIALEPCVRYRVVAVYEAKTGPDWTPKLYPESIGECRKKFGMGK
jgi:hypothetical protein